MKIKTKYVYRFLIVTPVIFIVLSVGIFIGLYFSGKAGNIKNIGMTPVPTKIMANPTVIPPSPTPIEYKAKFIDSPVELMEGGQATFTWTIDGPPKTIHKSAAYFGTISNGGILTKDVSPAETKYTDSTKEFLNGDFIIPIRFVGNAAISKPGKYFVRVYALIDNENYWSDERIFTVQAVSGHDIKILNYPDKVKLNDNSAFTWEITANYNRIHCRCWSQRIKIR